MMNHTTCDGFYFAVLQFCGLCYKHWASVAAVLCAKKVNIRPCWGCCSGLFAPYMVRESCARMFGSRLHWPVTNMSDDMTYFQDIHAVCIKALLKNYCLQKILSLYCSEMSYFCVPHPPASFLCELYISSYATSAELSVSPFVTWPSKSYSSLAISLRGNLWLPTLTGRLSVCSDYATLYLSYWPTICCS